jgi:hypothetical protein
MFVELPQNLILMTVGAFLLGWILSSISSRMGSASRAKKRDPRDDRIRSLEAELRIAQNELGQVKESGEQLEKELETANTAELSDRAEASVRSEAKLREVETELSVAQASTDMIATGVLDYSLAPDADDDDDLKAAGASKAAT